MECTPWVFHGQAMVISYGQKPMENSWNISMTFPWGISIRGVLLSVGDRN